MSGFKIPLDFLQKNIYEKNRRLPGEKSIKESIDDFIRLLVTSQNGSFKPDFRFGFSLKNYRFENTDSEDKINQKRLGGKSENFNNYAIDLKEAIEQYEPRLKDPKIKIDFNKEKSEVLINISSILADTKKEYKQEIKFHIW